MDVFKISETLENTKHSLDTSQEEVIQCLNDNFADQQILRKFH